MKKLFLTRLAVLSLLLAPVSTAADVSKEELAEAIRAKLDPWNSSASMVPIVNKLRGQRPDGSYEYAGWVKDGGQTQSRSFDLNLNKKGESAAVTAIDYSLGQEAYKCQFIIPEKRGGDNHPNVEIKEYTLEYSPAPDGKSSPGRVSTKGNVRLGAGQTHKMELEKVGKDVKIHLVAGHDLAPKGFFGNLVTSDPSVKIECSLATFKDLENPNQDLLQMALNPNAEALSRLGLPKSDIPPQKIDSFQAYGATQFESGKAIDDMKEGLREALSKLQRGRTDNAVLILQDVKSIVQRNASHYQTKNIIVIRLDEIIGYIRAESKHSQNYAQNMITELVSKSYTYPSPTAGTNGTGSSDPMYGDINKPNSGGTPNSGAPTSTGAPTSGAANGSGHPSSGAPTSGAPTSGAPTSGTSNKMSVEEATDYLATKISGRVVKNDMVNVMGERVKINIMATRSDGSREGHIIVGESGMSLERFNKLNNYSDMNRVKMYFHFIKNEGSLTSQQKELYNFLMQKYPSLVKEINPGKAGFYRP